MSALRLAWARLALWQSMSSLLVLAAPVHAQRVPPAETSAPKVEVTVLGRAVDLERIRGAIGPHDFRGARAEFKLGERWNVNDVLRRDTAPHPGVWCWIDVSTPGRARLYFADGARERFLLRDVPLPDGLSDLGREAVAQVLQMSVTALLEDNLTGISRADAERALAEQRGLEPVPKPEPEPERPSAPPSAVWLPALELGAFYAARLDSEEVPLTHGPGVVLRWITSRAALETSIAVTAQYELPQEHMTRQIGLEWQTTALRLGLELWRPLGRSERRLGARLGAGVDFVHVVPKRAESEPRVELTPERSLAFGVASAALGFCAPLGGWLGGCGQIFSDFYPTQVRYALALDDTRSTVFVPFRVRPGLALALVVR